MFHYWATLGQLRIASPRFSHLHGPWDRKEYLPQNHSQAFGFFEKKKSVPKKQVLGGAVVTAYAIIAGVDTGCGPGLTSLGF